MRRYEPLRPGAAAGLPRGRHGVGRRGDWEPHAATLELGTPGLRVNVRVITEAGVTDGRATLSLRSAAQDEGHHHVHPVTGYLPILHVHL